MDIRVHCIATQERPFALATVSLTRGGIQRKPPRVKTIWRRSARRADSHGSPSERRASAPERRDKPVFYSEDRRRLREADAGSAVAARGKRAGELIDCRAIFRVIPVPFRIAPGVGRALPGRNASE